MCRLWLRDAVGRRPGFTLSRSREAKKHSPLSCAQPRPACWSVASHAGSVSVQCILTLTSHSPMLIAFYFLSPVPCTGCVSPRPAPFRATPSPLPLLLPQGAIGTNLSLHKCFVRVEDEARSFWTVDDDEFKRGRHSQRGRPRKYCPLQTWTSLCTVRAFTCFRSAFLLLLWLCMVDSSHGVVHFTSWPCRSLWPSRVVRCVRVSPASLWNARASNNAFLTSLMHMIDCLLTQQLTLIFFLGPMIPLGRKVT